MAQRISMIFACLGASIVPVMMGHKSWEPKSSIDWGAANWAGIGSAGGAVIAMILFGLFSRSKG